MSIDEPAPRSDHAGAIGAFSAPRTVPRRNSARRANSSPGGMFVVVKTFAGATIGGALGGIMFTAASSTPFIPRPLLIQRKGLSAAGFLLRRYRNTRPLQ